MSRLYAWLNTMQGRWFERIARRSAAPGSGRFGGRGISRGIAAAAVALLAGPTPFAAASPPPRPHGATAVPQRFVGVNVDGPLFLTGNNVDLPRQLDSMVLSGVRSIRVTFIWSAAQPYATWAQVPPAEAINFVDVNGVPTDFSRTDEIVGLAAQRGLTVLPVVLDSPSWDAQANPGGERPPARTAPYANYLAGLVQRYGPHGTYWNGQALRLPIRMWQIWNEPNIPFYWPQPFATSYVALMRAAHSAIKRADPGAKTVLGALTNASWKSLAEIYKVHGARSTFDVVALDPYTSTPDGVITILKLVRQTVNRSGDPRSPLLVTEVGWTSALGQPCRIFDWDTTAIGQARNIAALLPLLAASRKQLGLLGFYYYTWLGDESAATYDFNFAGLLRFQHGVVTAKPALAAFASAALALEK